MIIKHLAKIFYGVQNNPEDFNKFKDNIEALFSKEMATRIPDNIQWPRYENGSLVKFGDNIPCKNEEYCFPVKAVSFIDDGSVVLSEKGAMRAVYRPGEYVKSQDSWEKIENDIEKDVLKYWNCGEYSCSDCPFMKVNGTTPDVKYGVSCCTDAIVYDLIYRAKKLAGKQ